MSSSHPPQPSPSSPAPYPPSCTRRRSPGHLPQLLPPALASCPRQSVRETCESSFQLPLSPKPRPRPRPTWHQSGGPGDTRPPEAALTLPDVHGSFRNSFTELCPCTGAYFSTGQGLGMLGLGWRWLQTDLVVAVEGGAASIWWVQVRDAAQLPATHRTARGKEQPVPGRPESRVGTLLGRSSRSSPDCRRPAPGNRLSR